MESLSGHGDDASKGGVVNASGDGSALSQPSTASSLPLFTFPKRVDDENKERRGVGGWGLGRWLVSRSQDEREWETGGLPFVNVEVL